MTQADLVEAATDWKEVRQEIMRYLGMGNDFFIVEKGAWKVEFDAEKTSKHKEQGK